MGRFAPPLLGLAAAASLGLATWAADQGPALPSLPAHPLGAVTPAGLLAEIIPDGAQNAEQLRRGQALTIAGDCMSCHIRDGGQPFAGGLGLNTPFGVIYSANITPDANTGIGAWTNEQFYRAMHEGVGAHGENLYPAFPYPWFSRASRADDEAIFAYLKTLPAVKYVPPANHLPFPLNIRFMVKGWNLLFFRPHDVQADAGQSAEWNHGAEIVSGLGHCGGCHTPLNFFGAAKSDQALQGGDVDNWVAPNLTANARTGLGAWSVDDISEYLRTGRNARASAGGSMAEVVSYSTSLMSDQDRRAIAVYLKSQTASPDRAPGTPDPGAMRRGGAIYSDACASCHLENGVGQPRFFPPLGHDAMLQQADPTGLEHLILAGGRVGPTATRPSPLIMPSFAWKLTDDEVADVSTFIRNSWGNQAAPVDASKVRTLRRRLGLQATHYTANSGDQG
ncbi:cytochrome c [Phenylobacterium sp.]|uniref:c-type cytochrome n=1 Tax=Phenylobacterium sp. TaxID=1871053 RepID=UPI0011FE475E|nr:cytochrome c [Phenylobacterium sp.]THD54645.1 MAG: c-type cytochrome [Phenylobacterium sp.]